MKHLMSPVSSINVGLLSQLFSAQAACGTEIQGQALGPSPAGSDFAPAPEACRPGEVVVVRGQDRMERVLERYGISCTEVQSNCQFSRLNDSVLAGAKYLFVNCGGELHRGDPRKIAEWVQAGGCLLSSDRMVYHLLEAAFFDETGRPLIQNLRVDGRNISTDESEEYYISKAAWQDPAARVFLKDGEKITWLVRKSSYPMTVLNSQRVQVLASSSDLGDVHQAADPLVIRFPYGRGVVLHLISHWADQEFDQEIPSERPAPPSVTVIREK